MEFSHVAERPYTVTCVSDPACVHTHVSVCTCVYVCVHAQVHVMLRMYQASQVLHERSISGYILAQTLPFLQRSLYVGDGAVWEKVCRG